MPFDDNGNWYDDYTGGGFPVFPPNQVILQQTPPNYSFILQAILDTLKEIKEELGYIKSIVRG
jgi:hypothetical protein